MAKEFSLNPITGKLDLIGQSASDITENDTLYKFFRGVLASAPASPEQGWTYIDSGDNTLYIYYGATWQSLHTLTLTMNFLLLENGDKILLEDGTSKLALEN